MDARSSPSGRVRTARFPRPSWRAATPVLPAGLVVVPCFSVLGPAAATEPGSSSQAPCRRQGRRPGQAGTAGTTIATPCLDARAGAQAKAGQQVPPVDPVSVIGPQGTLQSRARLGVRVTRGTQRLQRL